jgi:hypothetical protein
MVEMKKMDMLSYEMISVIGNCVTTVVAGGIFSELQRARESRADLAEIRLRCAISEPLRR